MKFVAKRAIILAAGRGARLSPLTDRTPKSLLVYDGIPIIERIIQRVRSAGITQVIVVTGYKAGQFDYLPVKYSEVSLLFNSRWSEGNNVLSVYSALDFFSDALVINGDAIITADVLQKEYERTAVYADRSVGFSKEWELVLDGKGYLESINTSGGLNILQHREVTFICSKDFDAFKRAVCLKVEEQKDMDSYFEFCILPWCEIGIVEVPHGVIFDLDDYESWIASPLTQKSCED